MATTAVNFARTGDHPPLLRINPGIPACEALEEASLFLAAAYDMAKGTVMLKDAGNDVWGMAYLIETAKAVVDSVVTGIIQEGGQS
jgi:formaldehyde-activating enzyme involved in methanogenesis